MPCMSTRFATLTAATIAYTYDLNGSTTTKTALSPNQPSTGHKTVTTTYTYDALNRLASKKYTDSYQSNGPTPAVTYGYDGIAPTGCTPPTVTAPTNSGIPTTPTNTIGRQSSMCDGSGATAWIYDAMGRPTIEERKLNNVTKNVGYVYYLSGHLHQLWYPSGDRMVFNVTGAGRADGVTDSSDNYVADNAKFVPNGMLSSMSQYTRSGSYSVGLSRNFFYNNRFQRSLEYAGYGSVFLLAHCYDYHLKSSINVSAGGFTCSYPASSGDNGNIYQIANKLDDTRTQNFSYDPLNRVQQAYTNGSNWGQQFTIDAWSNLTVVGALSGKAPVGVFTASINNTNQLVGSSYSYDAAGNMLSDGNGAISYDAENRINATNGVTYTYDGDGKRVMKSNGTLYWTGAGSDALSESDLSGNINEEYVFFNGMRVSRVDRPSGTVHAFLDDHLGSSRMIVTPSGTNTLKVEQDLDYTPYGIVASGSAVDHYQFTGKERDSESNLDDFGARYYASSTGRFMTPDWSARATAVPYAVFGDPQTLNLYTYVENAPINRADADGHGGPTLMLSAGQAGDYVESVCQLMDALCTATVGGGWAESAYAKFADWLASARERNHCWCGAQNNEEPNKPNASSSSSNTDSGIGKSVTRGYKWYKFITGWFNKGMEAKKLKDEMQTDLTIQHIAQESILDPRVLQAHPQFIEIYQREEQNLLLDVGRQTGRLMGEVPGLAGVDKFGEHVFNYYGQMRDENNRQIDQLVGCRKVTITSC